MRPLELAAHITILILVCICIGFAIFSKCRRLHKNSSEEAAAEEAPVKTVSKSLDRIKPISPQLPSFKTRSSLSMSSSPVTPRTPKSPGIRFAITPPSLRSRKSGSIDSLPSVETVLEQYEREAEAAERLDKTEHNQDLKEEDLGEPGPSIVEEEPLAEKTSAWD